MIDPSIVRMALQTIVRNNYKGTSIVRRKSNSDSGANVEQIIVLRLLHVVVDEKYH